EARSDADHRNALARVIGIGPGFKGGDIGLRTTFADIGETVAEHLGLAPGRYGTSFYTAIGGHA
ncbi:phosphopentomutase, partial [Mesorhizobium sp. M7A.T.Ca.TU.009.01.1.2]